jgi:hypothetical protein
MELHSVLTSGPVHVELKVEAAGGVQVVVTDDGDGGGDADRLITSLLVHQHLTGRHLGNHKVKVTPRSS